MAHFSFHFLIALVSLVLLAFQSVHTSYVPSPPPPPPPPKPDPIASLPLEAFEFIEWTNGARRNEGVPPLQWNWAIANASARLVNNQRVKHNCRPANLTNSKFGLNQHWTKGFEEDAKTIVFSWSTEKRFYNYTTNTCKPRHQCGLYKQLVWKTSKYMGCSSAKCPPDKSGMASKLSACYFYPPGNVNDGRPF